MPRKKEEMRETLNFNITLPNTRKMNQKERQKLFKKMKSLIMQEKEEMPIKDVSFNKNVMILDAVEFGSVISFDKPISVIIGIGKDLEKNKNRANDLANKIGNYINTILGESAKNAILIATIHLPKQKGINLARKFVEEARLVKINELIKKTINPIGILFEYKSDEHENFVMHFYDEKITFLLTISRIKYKDIIPWDFIIEEYNNLKESTQIIEKLVQKEF